jgi:hypothetical protein
MSLVRFSSRAAAEFVMLDVHADPLLRIIGKIPGPDGKLRGVVTADDAPAAIAALRAALAHAPKPSMADASSGASSQAAMQVQQRADEDSDSPLYQPVALAQRAYPLIDMLEQARRSHADVLWGV